MASLMPSVRPMHRHIPPALATRAAIVVPSVIALACSIYLLVSPSSSFRCPTASMSTSPSSAKPQNFSLWAMPSKDSAFYKRSKEAIQQLSEHFSCVPFEPHVTVLGTFGADQGLSEDEVVLRSWQIVKQLRPYDAEVMSLATGGSYFQSVFLKMRPTEQVPESCHCISLLSCQMLLSHIGHIASIRSTCSSSFFTVSISKRIVARCMFGPRKCVLKSCLQVGFPSRVQTNALS